MATWQPLGLIVPTINQYVSAPIASVGGETFRITFQNLGPNPPERFRSYGWLDTYYATGDRFSGRKIYPSTEPLIVHLPIPSDLAQSGQIVRFLRVMKKLYFNIGRANEPLWRVYVEELIPSPESSEDFTIELF